MTKQMQVLLAAKALVQAALPLATIAGFDSDFAKPQRVPDNGIVIGHPGEPGDPDVDLSPLAYNYSHRLFLEVAGPDIDGMLERWAWRSLPTRSWAGCATGSASKRRTSTTAART
jgi:hypothetical protein